MIALAWLRMSTSSRAISSPVAPASRMAASVRRMASRSPRYRIRVRWASTF
ncbi:hypothetical protein ACFVU3_27565 [Streptomyces sp. NPDC058052]|uniref:hypothetical protein n=1 Tax=Streptomyces sp. NPDC058052 TaxID=3346316 RepID=UPI0036E2638B